MIQQEKISVFLIAHNEEANIERSLRSLESQTKKPDEIILVAHNCTDTTIEKARAFPFVRIVEFKGTPGTAYARAEGFRQATGTIIVSTDGDTELPEVWLEELVEPFKRKDTVGVGSLVIYTGTVLTVLGSVALQFPVWFLNRLYGRAEFYGPSFAVRKEAYEQMGGLTELFELKEKVGLSRWLEDNFIANRIAKHGKVHFMLRPVVFARSKVIASREMNDRLWMDLRDRKTFSDKVAR